MNTITLNNTFDPQTLADDLAEVRSIYARFFASLDESRWDRPAPRGSKEWNLHETIAHLCALKGDGLESLQRALRGETYTFKGLDTRYEFNGYNRRGIDEHLGIPVRALWSEHLRILEESARLARALQPGQGESVVQLPIYNRPVRIVEALSIIAIHAGLFHTAQVAEPVGRPPLWMHLSPEIRHRMIGRVMRALSLLYRRDIGGSLRGALVFRVGGPGGGEWRVELSPEAPASGEGAAERPRLAIHLRDTAAFCQMFTGRLNLPLALIGGSMKLRGDLRLFLRMGALFSVDARPPGTVAAPISTNPRSLTGDNEGGV